MAEQAPYTRYCGASDNSELSNMLKTRDFSLETLHNRHCVPLAKSRFRYNWAQNGNPPKRLRD